MSLDLTDSLKGFRLRAEVDWVEVEVRLSRPTQARHLRDRMFSTFGNVYVEPLGDEASSSVFRFRVQDPGGPEQFMRDIQCVRRPDDPQIARSDVTLCAIEVALDAYREGASRSCLSTATCFLLNRLTHLPSAVPKLTGSRHFRVPASLADIHQSLVEDPCSVNLGDVDGEHRVRAYVKDYDTPIGGAQQPLPVEQHRARIEVTLSGSRMPFRSIDGWRSFRFETLCSDYFAMCRPVADEGAMSLLQQRKLLLGRAPDAPKVRSSDRRKRPPATRRDSVTNSKIRDALRALTKRQACRNLGTFRDAASVLPEGRGNIGLVAPKYLNDGVGPKLPIGEFHQSSLSDSDSSTNRAKRIEAAQEGAPE